MKKLVCHCGAVEAAINVSNKLEKSLDVIAQFAKKRSDYVYG